MRKLLAATLTGLTIGAASPAPAQWGGYGDMGHGFGYSGYGQGDCGFGECDRQAGLFVNALAGMASGAAGAGKTTQSDADDAPQPQSQAAPQKATRARQRGTCHQQRWDATDGWVSVAFPCR